MTNQDTYVLPFHKRSYLSLSLSLHVEIISDVDTM